MSESFNTEQTKLQIKAYLETLDASKKIDLMQLHELITAHHSNSPLWFLDGKNEEGKVLTNPNIGYGTYQIQYSNGKTKEFYTIGLSANTQGISVYFMGLDDKNYLKNTLKESLGKASITGYCVKFKSLKDINLDVLLEAINSRLK